MIYWVVFVDRFCCRCGQDNKKKFPLLEYEAVKDGRYICVERNLSHAALVISKREEKLVYISWAWNLFTLTSQEKLSLCIIPEASFTPLEWNSEEK